MTFEIGLLLAGAAGAFVKDIVQDGAIQLPFFKDGQFFLGFIGGMIIGAFVGYAVDNNIITALFSGYAGSSLIQNLIPRVPPDPPTSS